MGEMVSYRANGGWASGYLARPVGKGPGVIVLQEIWGLTADVRDHVERFAREGFVALAPDLWNGVLPSETDEAMRLMRELKMNEAEKQLRGAIACVLQQPEALGDRVGMMGFCLGGDLAYLAATRQSNVGACIIFYAGFNWLTPGLISDEEGFRRLAMLPNHDGLQAPVLCLYAERDSFATPEIARRFQNVLLGRGKSCELQVLPAAGHSFFNHAKPELFNPDATAKSWELLLEFLRKALPTHGLTM